MLVLSARWSLLDDAASMSRSVLAFGRVSRRFPVRSMEGLGAQGCHGFPARVGGTGANVHALSGEAEATECQGRGQSETEAR